MSSDITLNADGSAKFFMSRGRTAWHRLGNPIPGEVAPEEAQKLAGATFRYELAPLFTNDPIAGGKRIVEGRSAIVRDDTGDVLDVVGGRYEIVQPGAAFDFFVNVAKSANVTIETGGVLRNGAGVWALASVATGDVIAGAQMKKYVLFSNSIGRSVIIKPTGVLVVCANTEAMALSDGEASARIRHTRGVHKRIEEATEAVQSAGAAFVEELAMRRRLANVQADPEAFFQVLHPSKEGAKRDHAKLVREEMLTAYNGAPGSNLARGSLYAAVNAATYVYTHGEKSATQASEQPGGYLDSFIDGALDKKTQEVYRVAVMLANGKETEMLAHEAASHGVSDRQIGGQFLADFLAN